MVHVKICGITRPEDAIAAAEAGADAIGLVFAESPRRVSVEQARAILAEAPPFVTPVGLFVNEALEGMLATCESLRIRTVQLHGDERPEVAQALAANGLCVIKAFRVGGEADLQALDGYPAAAYLLDSRGAGKRGGTGVPLDWGLAARATALGRIILAGGLTPDNVAEAVRRVRPYAVDVSSGVEARPGIKDPAKVGAFIAAARRALSLTRQR
ncbi:MAG: phosphoribosylanthranilate isomerase [Planctomycetes bacterium]|nr:phosphoribosylanthranilate isomerase [Planctomycetota bacterium]